MATQITHIVLADKVYPTHFSHLPKQDFLIGNIFPDIRFLGGVSRDATHFFDLTLADVTAETNAFRAGMKLHSLVDLVREAFVMRHRLYDLVQTSEKKYTIPKLLEDELFYDFLPDWHEVINFLDTILPEEHMYGVPNGQLVKWHKNLQDYFLQPPTDDTRRSHALDLGVSAESVDEINRALAALRSQPRAVEIARTFYDDFEALISAWTGRSH